MEKALATSGNTTPSDLLEMAVSKDADIDKLEKLMDLKLRWEENEARKEYHNAMAMFKADPLIVPKDQHVKFGNTKYDHASLFGLVSVVTPKLSENGLSMSWDISQEGGKIKVTCVVTHRNGHSERVPMESAADTSGGKNAIQAIGSATEYLRRYTALAILGIAAGGDDNDGRGPKQYDNQSKKPKQNARQPETQKQKPIPSLLPANKKEWVTAISRAIDGHVEGIKAHRAISEDVLKELLSEAEIMKGGIVCVDTNENKKVEDCADCETLLTCPAWT